MKPPLLERLKARRTMLGPAVYAAVLSLVLLALSGVAGLALHLPWLFPSLGPTVMLFFESPDQPSSRPANTLVGHLTGLVMGVLCLYAVGLKGSPPAPVGGLSVAYVAAGALSVALTTLLLTWLRKPHPPAGATTLIVSLGILTTPPELLSMAGAVVLITAAGWGLNLLLGTKPVPAK
ncbi:HPP family protein [Arthrobacter sp. B3I4]|uniref:HPP family protein n=1 Tax=Arthrobacter sp. B3I4 TaxID=3042267 RepID=UPI0027848C9F|nr:HPP family protein [Arthrobacter sp. B3I4]MDQ0755232.1 CBS-domain-containing membrane protein [Arthrobacter sp. B3I4]